MKKLSRFTNINDGKLSGGKHFRQILWILTKLDPIASKQVESLRGQLEYDPDKYLWFANQGQNLFSFFSDDVIHNECNLIDAKYYVKKKNMPTYFWFLPSDLRKAMVLFWSTV